MDKTGPGIKTLETADTDGDGYIDRLEVTYTEAVDSSTLAAGQFSVVVSSVPYTPISVVDDDPDVLAYLLSLFEDNGYALVSAVDGVEAMEKIRSEKIDLVTLDISMPEKSGIRFYREIKADAELKNIPIVIVTGVESTYDGGSGKDFERFLGTRKQIPPPDGFIMKPIEEPELLGTIKKLLSD